MPRLICSLAVLFVIAVSAASVSAAHEDGNPNGNNTFLESLSSRQYMTGDWGGLRDRLVRWGLTPTAEYSADFLGNPVGGEQKKFAYAALFNLYLDFDLEKIFGLSNTNFVVSGSWASGRNLSSIAIDNFFTVSNNFDGNEISLYQLYLESSFFDGGFTAALGRMGIGDDFATAEVFEAYVSAAFDSNPISLTYNIPAFLSNPDAALGARVILEPSELFYLMAGIYNASPGVSENARVSIKLDFGFDDGVILISEAGLTPGSAGGLGGEYKLGVYYDTGKFTELDDEEAERSGNYGFYVIAQQMVYSEGPSDGQGLTVWVSGTLAPEEEINTFPYFVSGGLVYEGIISGRDEDVAAFGAAYGSLSRDLGGLDYEIALEWTYMIQVFPWLEIQPDLQLIVHPGGDGGRDDALVTGLQLSLDL